mgnify:CR=1 FL=1
MKVGDMVRNKNVDKSIGLFLGLRTFDGTYECAEVMWLGSNKISPIQTTLLEVVK